MAGTSAGGIRRALLGRAPSAGNTPRGYPPQVSAGPTGSFRCPDRVACVGRRRRKRRRRPAPSTAAVDCAIGRRERARTLRDGVYASSSWRVSSSCHVDSLTLLPRSSHEDAKLRLLFWCCSEFRAPRRIVARCRAGRSKRNVCDGTCVRAALTPTPVPPKPRCFELLAVWASGPRSSARVMP
jgi:hypothetical protein